MNNNAPLIDHAMWVVTGKIRKRKKHKQKHPSSCSPRGLKSLRTILVHTVPWGKIKDTAPASSTVCGNVLLLSSTAQFISKNSFVREVRGGGTGGINGTEGTEGTKGTEGTEGTEGVRRGDNKRNQCQEQSDQLRWPQKKKKLHSSSAIQLLRRRLSMRSRALVYVRTSSKSWRLISAGVACNPPIGGCTLPAWGYSQS